MASSDSSFIQSEGNSRKRLKISRSGAKASTSVSTATSMPSATVTRGDKTAQSSCNTIGQQPCHHEAALKILSTDLDAMRHLITCQICHRLMYEPYTLSCGHTYCYSCSAQWFGSNRKKTCPDCRAVITQQPSPSYVVREMVVIFTSRAQLLPDGETMEEHEVTAKEESEIVAKDKANTDRKTGGLFKGCFSPGRMVGLLPLIDPGDGVERCPRCHWELEDAFCNHCGHNYGEDGDEFSDDSMMTDDEYDAALDAINDWDAEVGLDETGEVRSRTPVHMFGDADDANASFDTASIDSGIMDAAFGPVPNRTAALREAAQRSPIQNARRYTHRPSRRIPIDDEDEEEDESSEDDDEDSGSLHDFIDDRENIYGEDEETETEDSDDDTVQSVPHRPARRAPNTVVISDDEDTAGATSADAITVDDSDEEAPIPGTMRRTKRNRAVPRRRAITVSSDEESEKSDSEVGGHDDNEGATHHQYGSSAGGFSPLQDESEDAESTDHDASSEVHRFYSRGDDDDDDESDESEDNELETRTNDMLPAHSRFHRMNPTQQYNYHPHGPPFTAQRGRSSLLPATLTRSENEPAARSVQASPYFPTNHPFHLSNVLAQVNNRHQQQQQRPHNQPPLYLNPARSIRSSNFSSPASGGVQVESYPGQFPSGGSSPSSSSDSSGSSHTLTAPEENRNEQRGRKVAARNFSRPIGGYGRARDVSRTRVLRGYMRDAEPPEEMMRGAQEWSVCRRREMSG